MITLEELLNNYRTYKAAFEETLQQLGHAEVSYDKLWDKYCDLKEKNEDLDRCWKESKKNYSKLADECYKLGKENEKLDEDNKVLVERLIVRDCENIKLARRIRELEKELAEYRGEED